MTAATTTTTIQYRQWKRKKQWVQGATRTRSAAPIATRAIGWLSLWLGRMLVWFALILSACASATIASAHAMANVVAQGSRVAVMNDGPSPAAQTSANMPQARLTIHYNKVFMQWLYAKTNKLTMMTHMDLPEKSGQTFRNFMNIPLPADLNQQTEGTIGNPEQISVDLQDIVVSQYANYTNLSDFAFMTSITDDMEDYRRIMAYQLALTIDDLATNMMDYLRTYDTRTTNQDSTVTPYAFTKNIIEQMPGSLGIATVPEMKNGFYNGSIHPAFTSDMAIDNSNNSVVDIWKHTEMGQLGLKELTDSEGSNGMQPMKVYDLFGCHWRSSTNQTQVEDWEGSGLTAIYTYLSGIDGTVFINFPNKRHTELDPEWKNMNLWAGEYRDRTAYDPNNLIIGGTGYNAILGMGLPPDTTSRMRIAGAVPQTT